MNPAYRVRKKEVRNAEDYTYMSFWDSGSALRALTAQLRGPALTGCVARRLQASVVAKAEHRMLQ